MIILNPRQGKERIHILSVIFFVIRACLLLEEVEKESERESEGKMVWR